MHLTLKDDIHITFGLCHVPETKLSSFVEWYMAERGGFEPPVPCGTTAFEAAPINQTLASLRAIYVVNCEDLESAAYAVGLSAFG
jgi:hypothetical protein